MLAFSNLMRRNAHAGHVPRLNYTMSSLARMGKAYRQKKFSELIVHVGIENITLRSLSCHLCHIMPFVKSKIYIIFIAFYVFFQLGINFEIFLLIKKEFKKLIS